MLPIISEWVSLLVRWVHVIAGIAWIGSSFYFIALDAGLKHRSGLDEGVAGEQWQVHGGGFYRMQKYLVAPSFMPAELVWFKWESYATWIFGFALLILTYYLHADTYLIDRNVADLGFAQAIAIGLGSLALGWVLYDQLCKSWIGQNTGLLAFCGFALLVLFTVAYTHLFSGRGAFIHVGALIGSLMTGNVFFVIMPNQRVTVKTLIAGGTPDPRFGKIAKQRSLHNNYLVLPVIFVMLSNHYAFTYSGPENWLILSVIFIVSFLIRHFFNQKHAGQTPQWWLWPVAAGLTLALIPLTLPKTTEISANTVTFADAQHIITQRCAVCHSAHPTYDGISEAPKGIMFDTPAQIIANAPQIKAQAIDTDAMPLGNATEITPEERQKLGAWIEQGAKGP